jgi:hypothetical protein
MDIGDKNKRIAMGGIFFLAQLLLAGCDSEPEPIAYKNAGQYPDWEIENSMVQKPAGVMTELGEFSPNSFRIVREYPSSTTGVVINRLNGSKEVVPQDRLEGIMAGSSSDSNIYSLGTVLTGGLLGYMMGRGAGLSPHVYQNQDLYIQSLANRSLIENRIKEEEEKRTGWSGRSYYFGTGGRYDGRDHYLKSSSRTSLVTRSASGTTGFFSHFSSGKGSSG